MIKDQGNGFIEVQGIKCFLPKKPSNHNIQNYGKKKKDQKWERTLLPTFKPTDIDIWDANEYDPDDEITWEEAYRQEQIKKAGWDIEDIDKQGNPKFVPGVESDADYSMSCLDAFRAQELKRIKEGHWIFINGEAYYLPGPYYFYLNYWWVGDCYPEFRYPDLELFCVWEYVRLHPTLLGLIWITMRGVGKSSVAGCIYYWSGITKKYSHCGMQSKTDKDAESMFREKVLIPMSKLPEFLVPWHKGKLKNVDVTDLKSITWSPPSRGKMNVRLFNKIKKQALLGLMDYRASGEKAYDSTTLRFLLQDEIGKDEENDVYERLLININTVWRGNKKTGAIFSTSTVEKMEAGGKECKKIWDESDQNKLNDNGKTSTGLVRIFRSALDATYFDEYGFPEREKAKKFHDAERESKKHDTQSLVAYKQKNPYTVEEAFWVTGNKCIYNLEILLTALDRCESVENKPYRKGDIVWKEKDKEAMWVPNSENGRWTISWVPPDEELNRTQINDGWGNKTFTPKMSHRRAMAFDPFATEDVVDEGKASDGAAAVYNKANFHVDENFCDTIIADYRFRPNDPFECYEDILTAAFFFSCSILVEKNKSNFFDYARHRGYKWGNKGNSNDFIMERPESTITDGATQTGTDGIYSGTGVIAHYTTSTRSHIVTHGHKLKHPNIIKDWIEFNPKNTKKFDSGVAGSLAVVANEKIITQEQETIDLSGIFQTYNNTGTYSEING